jgi:AcrR family transcriptional regulator
VSPKTEAQERRRDERRDDRGARRAARRAQLLDDAVEAIRELGAGVTMDQLARRGGVTKPILYRHFGDRDGLIAAIAERFATGLLAELDRTLSSESDRKALVESTVDAYLGFIEAEPHLYRFLVHQSLVHAPGPISMSPMVNEIARRVALVIGEELRADGSDTGAAVPWAYGIVGLVHQAGDWWLDERTMTRQALAGYLCDLLWNGLGSTVGDPSGDPAGEPGGPPTS